MAGEFGLHPPDVDLVEFAPVVQALRSREARRRVDGEEDRLAAPRVASREPPRQRARNGDVVQHDGRRAAQVVVGDGIGLADRGLEARRIATAGYYVVLPNLYYRTTREFDMSRDPGGGKRMFELMRSLTNDLVMDDVGAILAYAGTQAAARKGKG